MREIVNAVLYQGRTVPVGLSPARPAAEERDLLLPRRPWRDDGTHDAANTHDNAAGVVLLDQVAEQAGGAVRKAVLTRGLGSKT
jgi:hypothetical protein